jgi:hypothetical protein
MIGELLIACALGQNALDGNLQRGSESTLDAGLQQGRRVNQSVAQQDYRARNLVVTGDVAGGRGFRGTVGYSAEGDFAARTGSDDSREFRANSALSSIAAIGQIPMNDRFGVATGIGAVSVRRDMSAGSAIGGGENPSVIRGPGSERMQFSARDAAIANSNRVRLDLATRSAGAGHEYATLFDPIALRIVPMAGGRKARLISSPFNGLVVVPTDDIIESLGTGMYGSALMRDDLRHGRATRDQIAKSYLAVANTTSERRSNNGQPTGITRTGETPTDQSQRNGYDLVVNALAERLGRRGQTVPAATQTPESSNPAPMTPEEAIKQIRAGFRLAKEPEAPQGAIERITGRAPSGANSSRGEARTTAPPAGAAPEGASAQGGIRAPGISENQNAASTGGRAVTGAEQRKLTADEVAVLVAHRDEINSLDGGTKEALDTLLRLGEESMRAGRYLSAERTFVSASLIAPDNPMALAGIANAQLAAGLDVAAAVSLRQLLLNYPELIGVVYARDLIGTRERLSEIAARAVAAGRDSVNAADYGMVAAYIGYQLDDRALIESGLALLEASSADTEFARILRSVWLRNP